MKIIKRVVIGLLIGGAFVASMAFKKENTFCKTIAITQIVEHPALDATYKGIFGIVATCRRAPSQRVVQTTTGDTIMIEATVILVTLMFAGALMYAARPSTWALPLERWLDCDWGPPPEGSRPGPE